MKKLYTIFVTLFWLTMMGLLFQKEVLPNFVITDPSGYKMYLTKDCPMRDSWMGIYYKDTKIGFSNTVVTQDLDDGIAGYRINELVLLRVKMLGETNLIKMRGGSFFSEHHRLKKFNYTITSRDFKVDVSGQAKGDSLNVCVDIGGRKQEKTFKIKQNTLISNSVSPILLFKKLDRHKEINFDIFDPITFGTAKVHIKNVGTEMMEFNKAKYTTDIFEIDFSGIKTRAWMKDDGDILKEESILGFTMYKETAEDAPHLESDLSGEEADLISEFSIPSTIEISNPRDVSYLKLRKNNVNVEIFKDEEVQGIDLSVPVDDIEDEIFVQSKDKRIITLAAKIIGNEKNSWVVAKKILYWVYDNFKKVPTLTVPSSIDALYSMQGDCNEHTILFTALARSVGIPTKMLVGLVYLDGAFYYHAWPKVYVGKWINMDPTFGQEIADATHIPLLEGGFKEQFELIRVIGDLQIEVIEYR